MSDPQNLKRYDFLEYITGTSEYPFVQGRKQSPDQHETETVIARFFSPEYLADFIEKILDGTLSPFLRSEQEEQVADGGQGQGQGNGEKPVGSGSNSSSSSSSSINSKSSSDRKGSVGGAKSTVIKVVGSNFNAR